MRINKNLLIQYYCENNVSIKMDRVYLQSGLEKFSFNPLGVN